MTETVSLNPFRCRMWSWHSRLEGSITLADCAAELDSVARHGQLIPVLGRVLHGDCEHDVELIYGARRLFVARHLNKPLLVELRALSDREALIAMDIENRQRRDISPYERGLSFARWLRAGHFHSQDELASALAISRPQVSRLLKFARLPSVVLGAFATATQILESWGVDLADALEDPCKRDLILQKARALAEVAHRPPAREVYRQLLAASSFPGPTDLGHREEVIRDSLGRTLFRIRRKQGKVTLLVPARDLSAPLLRTITAAIAGILDETERNSATSEPARHRVPDEIAGDDLSHFTIEHVQEPLPLDVVTKRGGYVPPPRPAQ
jgi:ParB family chromosome partitioning protein